MRLWISIPVLLWATVAWGDASPYCWPADLHYAASPTRHETVGCAKRLRALDRLCSKERNKGLSLCVTGVVGAGCQTYIPSRADCDAGGYVCSGMPAVDRCYLGGGDVGTNIPARTDVLPIPPPTCLATFPIASPTRHELRSCFKRLLWFQEKLCAQPRNSGLAVCVTQIWNATCLPYSPSDSDCIAGHYVCAAEPFASRCHF
jgi:hypothetical protein